MQYSISASNINKVDAYEIKCPLNKLNDVLDYLKTHSNKRCNIILKDNEIPQYFYEQINLIKAIAPNYTIAVNNFKILEKLLKENYNAYLAYPINDWETFMNLKELGVSDIIIDGALGFQMERIKQAKENINIRVSPTISLNATLAPPDSPNEYSFFIRPEDLHLYEDYIDIIDFQASTAVQEKAYFDIYNRGYYDYDLSILVPHLHCKVPNPLISSKLFATNRLNCEQKCKIPGKRFCSSCLTHFEIAKDLYSSLMKNN